MCADGAGRRVLLLTGPTAIGKSDWALALAERVAIEIVSVDSAQVYRGLDRGTAKPSPLIRARVPHHLIDIRDLGEQYSAGDFVADALECIAAVHARGALPVLVGGTGLYFRALCSGLAPLPRAHPQVRAELDAEAAMRGWPAMHAELAAVDPVAAARMKPSDSQRIQRALEVWRVSGRTLSSWHSETPAPASRRLRFERWALVPGDRARLHALIEQRLHAMLADGWLDEVRALHRSGIAPTLPALRAVGYRQLLDHVAGQEPLAAATAAALAATRQLAKRQLTWIRGEPSWRTIDPFVPGMRERWLAQVEVGDGPPWPVDAAT